MSGCQIQQVGDGTINVIWQYEDLYVKVIMFVMSLMVMASIAIAEDYQDATMHDRQVAAFLIDLSAKMEMSYDYLETSFGQGSYLTDEKQLASIGIVEPDDMIIEWVVREKQVYLALIISIYDDAKYSQYVFGFMGDPDMIRSGITSLDPEAAYTDIAEFLDKFNKELQ